MFAEAEAGMNTGTLKHMVLLAFGVNLILTAAFFYTRSEINDLGAASMNGRADQIRRLLKTDPSQMNKKLRPGETPLFYAMNYGYLDVAKEFLAAGMAPNAKSNHGEAPLLSATYYGRTEILELFAKHGADLNIQDKDGYTAALWAARFNLLEPLKLLLRLGALPNAIDNKASPLLAAVQAGNSEIVSLLLAEKADVNRPGPNGITPLHLATHLAHPEIFNQVLAQPEVDLDVRTSFGYSAIDIAIMDEHFDEIASLVDHGANLATVDALGLSQLFRVLLAGYPKEKFLNSDRVVALTFQDCRNKTLIEKFSLAEFCR